MLTSRSRKLVLQECTGCTLATADTSARLTNLTYFNQFPYHIQHQHQEVAKLLIKPRSFFDRAALMEFNTSLNHITADVCAYLQPPH